jgi:hypothetical protein
MRSGLLVLSPEPFYSPRSGPVRARLRGPRSPRNAALAQAHSLLARVTMAWSAALVVACSGPTPRQLGGLGVLNPHGLEGRLQAKGRIAAASSTTPPRPTPQGRR